MNFGYEDKIVDYQISINNLMYTFEVTKCCGYSTFITIYKGETLADLYKRVAIHFACDVVELFFLTPDCLQNRIPLSNKIILNFINENITCNPQKLRPMYSLPYPVVYKIYLNDGHHCNHKNIIETDDDHCKNFGNNCK